MKQCIRCNQKKDDKLFKKEYKDGVIAEYNVCAECRTQFINSKKGVKKDNS